MSSANPIKISDMRGINQTTVTSYNREQAVQQQERTRQIQQIQADNQRNQQAIEQQQIANKAEADRQYNNLTNSYNDVQTLSNKLNNAADRYQTLTERYNNAQTAAEQDAIEQDLRAAANEYNDISQRLENKTGEYNALLAGAKRTGIVNQDAKAINYEKHTISVNIQSEQKQPAELEKARNAFEDVKAVSTAMNATGEKYNVLIDRFNSAGSIEEQQAIKEEIEQAAKQYTAASRKLAENVGVYNAAVEEGKRAGVFTDDTKTLSYEQVSLTPEFTTIQKPTSVFRDTYLATEASGLKPYASQEQQPEQNIMPGVIGMVSNGINTLESKRKEAVDVVLGVGGDVVKFLNENGRKPSEERYITGGKDFVQAAVEGEPQKLYGAAQDAVSWVQKPDNLTDEEYHKYVEQHTIPGIVSSKLIEIGNDIQRDYAYVKPGEIAPLTPEFGRLVSDLGEAIKPDVRTDNEKWKDANQAVIDFGKEWEQDATGQQNTKQSDIEIAKGLSYGGVDVTNEAGFGRVIAHQGEEREKDRVFTTEGAISVTVDETGMPVSIKTNEPSALYKAATAFTLAGLGAAAAPVIEATGGLGPLFVKPAQLGIEGLTASEAAAASSVSGASGGTATAMATGTASQTALKAATALGTTTIFGGAINNIFKDTEFNFGNGNNLGQAEYDEEMRRRYREQMGFDMPEPGTGRPVIRDGMMNINTEEIGSVLGGDSKYDEEYAKERAKRYKEQTGKDIVPFSTIDGNNNKANMSIQRASSYEQGDLNINVDETPTRNVTALGTASGLMNLNRFDFDTNFEYNEININDDENGTARRFVWDDTTKFNNPNENPNRNVDEDVYRNRTADYYFFDYGFRGRPDMDRLRRLKLPDLDFDKKDKSKKKQAAKKAKSNNYRVVNRLRPYDDLLSPNGKKTGDLLGYRKDKGGDLLKSNKRKSRDLLTPK